VEFTNVKKPNIWHRRNFGEVVKNIADTAEFHWMAGKKISDDNFPPSKLA
jgi:hypothetical protein